MDSERLDEVALLRARVAELEARVASAEQERHPGLRVAGVPISWDLDRGTFDFFGLPGVMMWIDTTVAGLLMGMQTMVGHERFALCLQAEGRKGVQGDIDFLRRFPDFQSGWQAFADTFAAAGWGRWEVESLDLAGREARFRISDSWEGRSQAAMGVCLGSGILAGKLAGLCQHLFGTPCWAEQTHFLARGDAYDGFLVTPSSRTVEGEIERLLETDAATRADMAVALQRLREEVAERTRAQEALQKVRDELEIRVEERTRELADEVTERRRAEELFRRIAEGIPEPLAIFSTPDFRCLYLNPAFQTVLGYSQEDVPDGEAWFQLAYPDPERRAVAQLQVGEIVRQGRRDAGFETVIRCAGGRDREFGFRFISLEAQRYLVLAEDLTERKRTQQERERLTERLHRSQKMEALGMLAGGVAHDLNNLLSGLVTYPDLLLDSLPPDHPMHGPLTLIQGAGLRAAAVVEDLVTIARGVAVPREVCDLNRVVEGYLASPEFGQLVRAHPKVQIQTRLQPELLRILGAPGHLRKALANLVINAVEAGGRHVRIVTENRYVDAASPQRDDLPAGEYAVLIVEDDGPGIPAADLGRIFEPFFTKKVMGRSGTGLGLAVVWNTVQDHRGQIHVDSGPAGTRFEFSVPATRAPLPGAASPMDVTLARGHGERVLVVDDEESQRQIACELLRSLGYHAEAVAGGEQALRRLEEEPFDLVLLDMIMPRGLSGRETYERILQIRPGQKAIIASGCAETEDVRETQRLGAGAFLRKPYRRGQLGITIRNLLGPVDPHRGLTVR